MAIIYSYPQIGELATNDTIAISDFSNGNKTQSVTIGQLSDYFGSSVVRQAKKVLGPDEILSLSGPTPQFLEFVPAPGENKLIMPINIAYKLTPVSVPYNLSANLELVLNSFTIGLRISNGDVNSSQVAHGWDSGISNINTVSDIANQPINFTFNAGTVSQGDSILTVSMLYRIIDFS